MRVENCLEFFIGKTARETVAVNQQRWRCVHLELLVAGHALLEHLVLELLVVAALLELLRRDAPELPNLLQRPDRIGGMRPGGLRGEQRVDEAEESIGSDAA